ncbi:protein A26 [Aotine betaherpesvirus 1]|uniref:Protein A26 n=1 Tax=Aotine betaherpesvirus 1 TaxID=50290 RepID=G8XUJ9_9BETA|nr:protein A26 [Aotine betaherpesvirus 1]AEV80840.1 protein A26 [Aotine betaherpesvirus 1]
MRTRWLWIWIYLSTVSPIRAEEASTSSYSWFVDVMVAWLEATVRWIGTVVGQEAEVNLTLTVTLNNDTGRPPAPPNVSHTVNAFNVSQAFNVSDWVTRIAEPTKTTFPVNVTDRRRNTSTASPTPRWRSALKKHAIPKTQANAQCEGNARWPHYVYRWDVQVPCPGLAPPCEDEAVWLTNIPEPKCVVGTRYLGARLENTVSGHRVTVWFRGGCCYVDGGWYPVILFEDAEGNTRHRNALRVNHNHCKWPEMWWFTGNDVWVSTCQASRTYYYGLQRQSEIALVPGSDPELKLLDDTFAMLATNEWQIVIYEAVMFLFLLFVLIGVCVKRCQVQDWLGGEDMKIWSVETDKYFEK